jgi:HPt (histidine-containing phosphotransfer) domain-containing protein
MSSHPHTCLSIERAMSYVGDLDSVRSLLGTLAQSLQGDLPEIQARLDAGDLPGVQRLLHQFKGFAPVFCTEPLSDEVARVERLSKGDDAPTVRSAYAHLAPRLQQLLAEVQAELARPR